MCSNRRIQHGGFPPVTTEFHPVKGRILRLGATGVRQGTLLGEYIGEVIGETERKRRERLHGFSALAYTMNYSPNACIDAKRRGGIMRYASHQCILESMTVRHWQVDSRRHLIFEATHDIAPGAELHFNYFQNERNRAAISRQFQLWGGCSCEHKLCRQVQFLPEIETSS